MKCIKDKKECGLGNSLGDVVDTIKIEFWSNVEYIAYRIIACTAYHIYLRKRPV